MVTVTVIIRVIQIIRTAEHPALQAQVTLTTITRAISTIPRDPAARFIAMDIFTRTRADA